MQGALGEELLEREHETAALTRALDGARAGVGSVLLLEGAAGIGKSRLLETAKELARAAELEVLEARGEELERARPWALVRQLFTPALSQPGASVALGGGAAPAARLLDPGETGDGSAAGADPLPLIHALAWLAADLASHRPLLLTIDDAHWGDEPSLRFVRYLLPRVADLPLAVVIAMRPGEPGGDRAELESIAGDHRCQTIRLAALSDEAAAELVRAELGADTEAELISACAEVTGGNPLYLRELLRELRANRDAGGTLSAGSVRGAAPELLTRTVFLRLSRLGGDAAALARAVAILGDRASFPQAAELAGLDHRSAAAGLDALAGAEVLAPGEPLSFAHPLVGQVVGADILPGERGELHRRAADLLARDGAPPEDVASQLLLAGRRADPWTVETLRDAARRAVSQGAVAAARDYLKRALDEPPPPELRGALLADLAQTEGILGAPEAGERFAAALELTADPVAQAHLHLALGRVQAQRGEHATAAETFEAGIANLDGSADELGRELRAAWWMSARLDIGERVVLTDVELAVDGELTPAERQLLAQFALQRAFDGAHRDEICPLAERAWGDGALLEAETSDGLAWSLVTAVLLFADELERELEVCDAALVDARRRGSPMAFATVSYCRSFPLLFQGRIDDAVANAQAAIDAKEDGWSAFLAAAASGLALGQLERGALGAAREALALVEDDPAVQASIEYLLVLAAKGSVQLADGRPEQALASFTAIGEASAAAGVDFGGVFSWEGAAARAASAMGDFESADALARDALVRAKRTGSRRALAEALRARGHAAHGEEAIECFRAAVKALDGSPPRLERAHALVDLGAALRRAHRRAEARGHLEAGKALAVSGGAHALAERARTELAAAGARTAAHTRSGLESLTPSERRVAELAAAGQSNRAIAHSLFVTVKAVEYHLANVYRKLDVSGRRELGPLLGSAGAQPPGS